MNNKITAIISLAVGFAAGVTASYIYLKEKLTKEFEKKLTAEMLEYEKEHREKSEKPINNVHKEEKTDGIQAIDEHAKPEPKEVDTHKKKYNDYISLADGYKTETEPEDDEWIEEANRPKLDDDDPRPYVIDEDTHYDTKPSYDCVELTYDVISGQLIDDINGDVLDEIECTVGIDNLNNFIDDTEADEIFIRNEGWATDYVIRKETIN